MSQISLTAPMRSNLLALQNIARQQDIVQNRLATGLKVSSAIDNPSSYYTAASLSNRAADLTALLDAMSQGVQTIKTASEAIDAGIKFLEQAKAVANQALETAEPVVARVSNEEELLAAIDSGKSGIIIITQDIDLSGKSLTLNNGQSLAGATAFTANTPPVKLSVKRLFGGSNSALMNLSVKATSLEFTGNNIRLTNLDIRGSIRLDKAEVTVSGKINVYAETVFNLTDHSLLTIGNDTVMNSYSTSRTFNLAASQCIINAGAVLNVQTQNDGLEIFSLGSDSSTDIYGTINASCLKAGFAWLRGGGNNSFNIPAGARIYSEIPARYNLFPITRNTQSAEQTIFIEKGALLGFKQETEELFLYTAADFYSSGKPLSLADFSAQKETFLSAETPWHFDFTDFNDKVDNLVNSGEASGWVSSEEDDIILRLNQIIAQYDSLLKDASYKGINLLDGQKLKINFNEDRSAQIDVMGVKADSDSLGLKTKEWETAEDIEQSVSELEGAINTLRNYASQYGNYYSIVTTRQDFTENLINVLEEGADKLTLADMNEESANMLALQTSQQLAINSLSLASQAAQSVLKLF